MSHKLPLQPSPAPLAAASPRTHLEMAAHLQKLGAPLAAQRLEELHQVITDPARALPEKKAWAEHLVSLVDTESILETVRLRRPTPPWLRVLEWLRNVWVLMPLALTCYGIWKAVEAYHVFLTRGSPVKDVQTSFVVLWQTGFGGELTKMGGVKLNDLLVLDVLGLSLLVGLTVGAAFLRRRFTSRWEKEAVELREELTSLVFQSFRELASGEPDQIER